MEVIEVGKDMVPDRPTRAVGEKRVKSFEERMDEIDRCGVYAHCFWAGNSSLKHKHSH
jgi:hypothetical protein